VHSFFLFFIIATRNTTGYFSIEGITPFRTQDSGPF